MIKAYTVEGMTCQNCKAAVEDHLQRIDGITKATVDLDRKEVNLHMTRVITTNNLRLALPKKYSLSELHAASDTVTIEKSGSKDPSKWMQLRPLILILFYIATASILINYDNWDGREAMLDFMGLFYIVFSFFKMLDLKGFPESFRMYDPFAKQIPKYAWIYPFLETGLGLLFLFRYQIQIALIATIIILGITTIGVTRTILNKKSIRCACLGTVLQLPMTEATIIENVLMLTMAVTLLFT
ncbi:MAG: MauE/DoxX family redox-associated membrane protein [Bacteroidota bacterium]